MGFSRRYGPHRPRGAPPGAVASRFAHQGLLFNLFRSLVITLALGALSWFLLEKRCLALGKRCAQAVRGLRLVRLSGEA